LDLPIAHCTAINFWIVANFRIEPHPFFLRIFSQNIVNESSNVEIGFAQGAYSS